MRNGRALEALPALAAAASAGGVTPEAVKCGRAGGVGGEPGPGGGAGRRRRRDRRRTRAGGHDRPNAELRQVVGHYLARLDPEAPNPTPPSSGRWSIEGSPTDRLPRDPGRRRGEKFQAAVESIVQASRPAGDMRSRAQRRADALVQLCDNALASGACR